MLSDFEQSEISGQTVTFSDSPPAIAQRAGGKMGILKWNEEKDDGLSCFGKETLYNRDRAIKWKDDIHVCVTFQWSCVC